MMSLKRASDDILPHTFIELLLCDRNRPSRKPERVIFRVEILDAEEIGVQGS